MVNSGKEFLIIDSYNIPWLIWIQMFIFFLLLLLIFLFGFFSSDIVDNRLLSSSSDSAPSTSSASHYRFFPGDPIGVSYGSGFSVNSSHVQSNQMRRSQSLKGEITEASRRRTEEEEEESSSSEKDESHKFHHHPCNLFQLAGSAFLKCFGLDRSSDDTEDSSLRPESKKQR